MKGTSLVVFLLFCFLFSVCGFSQETEGFDMFYGKKDFGGISGGYDYLLNTKGYVSSLEFYYLTQSKKSAQAINWQNYYGVSLEFSYSYGDGYEIEGKDAEFGAWWIFLWIEDRLFAKDRGDIRPYFEFGGGLGAGEFAAKGIDDDFEIDLTQINIIQLRLGAGVQIMVDELWSLDFGISGVGSAGLIGGIIENADLTLGGVEARIGICKWTQRR